MLANDAINALRRLWQFLVTAFPGLGRIAERAGRWVSVLVTNPVVAPIWNRVVASPYGQAALKIVQQFLWRDYSKERIDAGLLPPEGHAVLRPVMSLAAVMCLAVPLAMIAPWPAVAADLVVGASGPVAGWSIGLWLLAMAVAWSSLLVGVAACNRPAFVATLVVFAYFLAYAAFSRLPPSLWNLPLPMVVLGALAFAEARCARPGREGLFASAMTVLAVGMGMGFFFAGLFPFGRTPVPLRLAAGAVAGLLVLAWTRCGNRVSARLAAAGQSAPVVQNALAALLVVFYLGLALRGGLGVPGSATVEFLELWSGYLWPVWYILGTGLIFKLLNQTRVLTQSIREVVPARWLVPVLLLLLAAGVVVAWSDYVLDTLGFGWPMPFVTLMGTVYHATAGFIWSEPLYAYSAAWMRWVLLVDLAIASWLAVRRRLTAAAILVLLGQTLLLWFVISQYYLNYLGFSRAGSYTPLVALLLAMALLWMLYRSGLTRAVGASPHWPAVGRVAISAAIMLFVVLEVHSRAALHDALAFDRIFLYTFRGVVDFGLPYLLSVYASRRLTALPVSTAQMIGAFATGAVVALSLNVLDKLVAAGGSLARLAADMAARFDLIVNGQMDRLPELVPDPSLAWTVTRGLLAVAALVLVAVAVSRRTKGQERAPAVVLFSLIAAGAGMAAFSQIWLELPIVSPRWAQLVIPYRTSMDVDAHIIALFLSYTLPAMVLGLAAARSNGATRLWLAAGVASAAALHVMAVMLWPGEEPWLRSSGMLWTCCIAGVGLFAVLLRAVRLRVEAVMPDAVLEGDRAQGALIGRRGVVVVALIGALAVGAVAIAQLRAGRLVDRDVAGLPAALPLPAAWRPLDTLPPGVAAGFTRSTVSVGPPVLMVELREAPEEGIEALLEALLGETAASLTDFELYRGPESWQHHLDGAVAVDFFFSSPQANGATLLMAGSMALLPVEDGPVVGVWLIANLHDFHARRWDMVLIAESLDTAG